MNDLKIGQTLKVMISQALLFRGVSCLKKNKVLLVLETSINYLRNQQITGVTKIQDVKTGDIYDIKDYPGYWCFLTTAKSDEYRILDIQGWGKLISMNEEIRNIANEIYNPLNNTDLSHKQLTLDKIGDLRNKLDEFESELKESK